MRNFVLISAMVIVIALVFFGVGYWRLNHISQNFELASGSCVTTGCSGVLCLAEGAEPPNTTCEWQDYYECYQKYSHCERQQNGQCGWTETPEFLACLAEKGPKNQAWDGNQLVLYGPAENQYISSPASFNGAAGGSWFEKGFFNVIVVDDNYVEVGRTAVSRPADFNQSLNAGNFSGQVEFSQPETSFGYLIISKPDAAINDPVNSLMRKVNFVKSVIEDDYLKLNCEGC